VTGRSWGTALTGGLLGCAIAFASLLGAVLHFSARPPGSPSVTLREPQPRAVPARTREGHEPGKANPKEEQRPPVRLWRGPTPDKHPPRPRRALA
jgi:hypothetical protein